MGDVQISTDEWIFWQSEAWPWLRLNATIAFSWLVMAILAFGSWLITRRLSTQTEIPRFQNMLEVLVDGIRKQIRDVSRHEPGRYLPFVGTLFLFIAMANLLSMVPWYRPPTGSLSTTAALATCVFVAVPIYGVASRGPVGYLKRYVQPTWLMLPFNIIGELSRTLALAVRLYGNMMSGTVIAAILIGFVPLFVPVLMQALGLLTGMIQAYIFAVLAMVYIASATHVQKQAASRRSDDPSNSASENAVDDDAPDHSEEAGQNSSRHRPSDENNSKAEDDASSEGDHDEHT